MTTLVTVEQVKARIATDLSDVAIHDVIVNEEEEVIRRYGAHGDGVISFTESREPMNGNLFLTRPFVSITSLTEHQVPGDTGTVLSASAYYAWTAQGRIERLPRGTAWGQVVTAVYVPVDDSAKRRRVIIELVRVALEQTATQAKSVGGEYSYTAAEFEAKRQDLYRRLSFQGI